MGVKTINFISPRKSGRKQDPLMGDATDLAAEQNWQTLMDNFKTLQIEMSIDVPTGSPTIMNDSKGAFALIGPLVFFTLEFEVPNGSGWTTTTTIDMPFTEAWRGNAGGPGTHGIGGYGFPIVMTTGSGFTSPGFCFLDTPAIVGILRTDLRFSANYTNTSGFTQYWGVSGWYFRA